MSMKPIEDAAATQAAHETPVLAEGFDNTLDDLAGRLDSLIKRYSPLEDAAASQRADSEADVDQPLLDQFHPKKQDKATGQKDRHLEYQRTGHQHAQQHDRGRCQSAGPSGCTGLLGKDGH